MPPLGYRPVWVRNHDLTQMLGGSAKGYWVCRHSHMEPQDSRVCFSLGEGPSGAKIKIKSSIMSLIGH